MQKIRSEFEALLEENAAKPEAERLPRSAFEVDQGLHEMIAEVSVVVFVFISERLSGCQAVRLRWPKACMR